jgi:hypothetical protein
MSRPFVARHRHANRAVAEFLALGAVACGSSGTSTKTGSLGDTIGQHVEKIRFAVTPRGGPVAAGGV